MRAFRFIHCADLHLGSAFAGLATADLELAKALSEATFRAFGRIVDLALSEHAAFVVIAGDVFDRAEPSLLTRRKFLEALTRLCVAAIPVFIAAGNHDPLQTAWTFAGELPSGVALSAVARNFIRERATAKRWPLSAARVSVAPLKAAIREWRSPPPRLPIKIISGSA